MTIDRTRRDLLRTTLLGAAVTAAALSARAQTPEKVPVPAPVTKAPKSRLKKALKYGMIGDGESVRERFQVAKDCGFAGIELDSPSEIDRDEVLAARDATGLVVHGVVDSIHWVKRFSDPDIGVREDALKALRTAIRDAEKYGATTVLVVPGVVRDPVTENREQCWSRSQTAIKKAIPDAKKAKVKIAIEVVWNDFLTTPDDLVRYVDEFGDPTVGAYFDASNMIKYGVPSAEWITKLGARMLKIDFKGYSKAKGWCGVGDGDEDWPAIVKALAEIGYDGFVTAELGVGTRDQLTAVSRKMDQILALG